MKLKAENKEVKIPIRSPKHIIKRHCKKWGFTEEEIRGASRRHLLGFVRCEIVREMKNEGFIRAEQARAINKTPQAVDDCHD